MSESGVEYLDEIGLVLNICVLAFVVLFHVVPFQQRQSLLLWIEGKIAVLKSKVSSSTEEPRKEPATKARPPRPPTWERRVGAWLVIWLLAYIIHLQLTRYEAFGWLTYNWDGSPTSSSIARVESVTSWFNFMIVGTLLMLLIPIPFLRRTWMLPVFGALALGARMGDSWGISNGWNLNLSILFVMLAALVCIIMSIRTLFFLPDRSSTRPEDLALRRSGYFALGATVILTDFMIYLVPGFFTGAAHSWWFGFFMNWSVVQHGHAGLVTTHVITSLIYGAFSLMLIGVCAGSVYHLTLVRRKKRAFGIAGVFAGYYLFLACLILIRFVAIERDFAFFINITSTPQPAGEYDIWTGAVWETVVVTEEHESRAVLIDALTRGVTEHLIYPCIALMHAVKFGLIRVRTEVEKKALRVLALALLVAIAAVFTEVLQEVLLVVGLPNNDIIFALVCGLVLATGWEKKLIDAMEPEKETLNITWKYPGNERVLLWTVNIMAGGAFLLQTSIGIFSPTTWGSLAVLIAGVVVLMVVLREGERRWLA